MEKTFALMVCCRKRETSCTTMAKFSSFSETFWDFFAARIIPAMRVVSSPPGPRRGWPIHIENTLVHSRVTAWAKELESGCHRECRSPRACHSLPQRPRVATLHSLAGLCGSFSLSVHSDRVDLTPHTDTSRPFDRFAFLVYRARHEQQKAK